MQRYAAQLAKLVYKRSGYIPNVSNLDLRPGTILSRSGDSYQVEGALFERVARAGDEKLAKTVQQAMERVTPKDDGGDQTKHKAGLNYKGSGTTMIASDAGIELKIPTGSGVDASVKANIVLSFEGSSDFVFDTTEPSPWFTFADVEFDDIRAAALEYLRVGEFLVTGAVFAKAWTWYISKTKNGTIAFSASGGGSLSGLGVESLAELRANLDLKVVMHRGEVVDGTGNNSVAAFQVITKRKRLLKNPILTSARTARDEDTGGRKQPLPESVDTLAVPTEEDVLNLVALPEDID